MNFHPSQTAKFRLRQATYDAIRDANRSIDEAATKLFGEVSEDPAMMLEVVRQDRMMAMLKEYVEHVMTQDMDGGGIGLRPVEQTGGNAVADEAGRKGDDAQDGVARPSAPQSQTPAATPVGGGQIRYDDQHRVASPSSARKDDYTIIGQLHRRLPGKTPTPGPTAWSQSNIVPVVKSEPKKPYVAPKPRISFADRAKAEKRYAKTILDTFMFRSRPIGDWTHEELANVAEISGREHRIAEAFMRITPAGGRVGQYVKPEVAEDVLRSLETANAS
jgi:hypothetical protein